MKVTLLEFGKHVNEDALFYHVKKESLGGVLYDIGYILHPENSFENDSRELISGEWNIDETRCDKYTQDENGSWIHRFQGMTEQGESIQISPKDLQAIATMNENGTLTVHSEKELVSDAGQGYVDSLT